MTTPGEATWKANGATYEAAMRLQPDGVMQVATMQMTATGVEIHIGNAVIRLTWLQTTDVAIGPIPREFVLSGNVRLRTVLGLSKRP